MRILRRPILIVLLLATVIMLSCTSDEFTVGNNFLDSNLRTILVDTCTVKLTSIPIDSVKTSGLGSVLFGSYSDSITGTLTSTAYISFNVPAEQSFPVATVIFDSLELIFSLNGTYMGDTTLYHKFNVYRLDNMIPASDDNEYYSTRSYPYDESEPMGTFTIKPKPNNDNTLACRLPDNIGEDLLNKILAEDKRVDSLDLFLDYFKGLAITSDNENEIILGAQMSDTSMAMRLYYHYSTHERVTGKIDFAPLISGDKAIENRCLFGITKDRTGSIFEGYSDSDLPSESTGNKALIQALTASYVKLEFPYLNNFLELGEIGAIIDAYLYIYPVKGTYSMAKPLPPELYMYESNEVYAVTNLSGDAQTGSLVIDDMFNIDTYYSYDITSILQDQLGAFGINKRYLQLSLPGEDLSATPYSMIMGNTDNKNKGVKLKIRYLIYDGK